MKSDEDAPRSRMLRRKQVPVNQVALKTSLQAQYECMPANRADRGIVVVDLLYEATDTYMGPLVYGDLFTTTPLCDLPSALAYHASTRDPNVGRVELEREARSALTDALPQIMEI